MNTWIQTVCYLAVLGEELMNERNSLDVLSHAQAKRIRGFEEMTGALAKRVDAMEAEKRELATVTEMAPYRLIGKRS